MQKITSLLRLPLFGLQLYRRLRRAPYLSKGQKRSLLWCMIRLRRKSLSQKDRNQPVQCKVLGMNVHAYGYANLNSLLIEIFAVGVYHFQPRTASPTIVDCGANIGIAVLFFKLMHPGSTVYAIEPNPNAFRLLKQNVEGNQLGGVHLMQVALTREEGEIALHVNEDLASFTASVLPRPGAKNTVSVPARKLSNVLRDLASIDYLKINIEGNELPVVMDLAESGKLAEVQESVIEYHHNLPGSGSSLAGFLACLEGAGLSYYLDPSGRKNAQNEQDIMIYTQHP